MAVRPVEFQGMIQNTHEPALARSQEQHRPQVMQDHASMVNQQNAQTVTTTVSSSQQSETDNFDASEGGDGTGYTGNRGQKKENKKKERVPDGVIRAKNPHGSFNAEV